MQRSPRFRQVARALAFAAVALAAGRPAAAQPVLETHTRLASDRPEAWGMKYAAATTAFGAFDPRGLEGPGALEIGFEAGTIPSLSTEEQRIGFAGTKVEELDRGPAFGRLRARFALPGRWVLDLGVVPPVELDGLEPLLGSAALGRTLVDRRRLRLRGFLALHGGRLEGDITCSRAAVAAGDDPDRNPLGCEEPSSDRLELATASLGLTAALPARHPEGFEPYLALALQHVDGRFEVAARYDGLVDRGVLTAEDQIVSVAVGGAGGLGSAWRLAAELGYTPLDLRRPGQESIDQSIWNARLLVSRRLR